MVLSNFDIKHGKVYRRLDIHRHMKIARAIYDARPSELLPQASCPALVIVATTPPANEAEQRWQTYRNEGMDMVREAMSGATVLIMENSIHDLPVQRPAELASALVSFASELA
jgi:pimeloyl-ACP methyl ester carboxylesterase